MKMFDVSKIPQLHILCILWPKQFHNGQDDFREWVKVPPKEFNPANQACFFKMNLHIVEEAFQVASEAAITIFMLFLQDKQITSNGFPLNH